MTINIILDACILIDLDLPEINFADVFIDFINKNDNYKFMISKENFDEVTNDRHSKMKRKIQTAKNFSVEPVDNNLFEDFSSELRNKLHITIQSPDRRVLFLGVQKNANLIATSDTVLFGNILRYRTQKHIHNQDQIYPINTVGILKILFEEKVIDSQVFFEKSLALFKFKEIDNFFNHLEPHKFRVDGEKQKDLLNECINTLKHRFQVYKDPIVDEYKSLKDQGLIRV